MGFQFTQTKVIIASLGLHILIVFAVYLKSHYQTSTLPMSLKVNVYFEEPKGVLANKKKSTQPTKLNQSKTNLRTQKEIRLPGFLRENKLMKPSGWKQVQREVRSVAQKNEYQKEAMDNISLNTQTTSGQKQGMQDGIENSKKALNTNIWQIKQDTQVYNNAIGDRVRDNFRNPLLETDFLILIEIHISNQGNLEFLEYKKRSGIAILDVSAEKAIRSSLPFPVLPDTFPQSKPYITTLRFIPDM